MIVSTVVVSMFLLTLCPPPAPTSRASTPVIRCYRVLKRPCALNFDSMGNRPTKVTRSGGQLGEISFLSRMLFWALCFKASQCLGTLLQVMMQKWSLTIAGGAFWWPPKFLFFPLHWFCCELSARLSLYQSPCKCKLGELQISWNFHPSQEKKKWISGWDVVTIEDNRLMHLACGGSPLTMAPSYSHSESGLAL